MTDDDDGIRDEFVAVDPAHGTEAYEDRPEPGQAPAAGAAPEEAPHDGRASDAAPALFTAPDKLSSVVQAVLATPSADPKVRGLLAALTSGLGRRLVLQPMLDLLPPLDEPDEWDAWL